MFVIVKQTTHQILVINRIYWTLLMMVQLTFIRLLPRVDDDYKNFLN